MLRSKIIEKIEATRNKMRYSQGELATLIGVHINTYTGWIRQKRKIDIENIEKIAEIFNVPVQWFFSPSDSPDTAITASPDFQQQILSNTENLLANTNTLLTNMEKITKRITISEILEEKNGSSYKASANNNSHAASTGELPNNVIPFPKNKTIPKFAQPIGAGYTLNGYHFDDVEGFFEMPLTRETRHIEAIAPVSGDSMYPEIHDGALVFIRPAKDFKDGDKLIVFLQESGELTLKYAFKVPPPKNNPQPHRGWISLQGFSDSTRKIYEYRDVEIQGIVVDWVNDRKTINEITEKLKSVPQE